MNTNEDESPKGRQAHLCIVGGQGAIATMHTGVRIMRQCASAFGYQCDEDYPYVCALSAPSRCVGLDGRVQQTLCLEPYVDQGAQLLVVPCNSLEAVLPQTVKGVPVLNPWRSALPHLSVKKHVILGSKALMQKAKQLGFSVPDEHSDLYQVLSWSIAQVVKGQDPKALALQVRAAVARHPWECGKPHQVVSACTELSVLELPYLDTMQYLIDDVCAWVQKNHAPIRTEKCTSQSVKEYL